MGLFSRDKNREELAADSAARLKEMVAAIGVLGSMTAREEVRIGLADVAEELTYSSPSAKTEVKKLDGKIANLLGDLKILLTSRPESQKIMQDIGDVKLLIVERNARCGG